MLLLDEEDIGVVGFVLDFMGLVVVGCSLGWEDFMSVFVGFGVDFSDFSLKLYINGMLECCYVE